MPAHRLTPPQPAFVEAFGYLALPGLIAGRVGRVLDAFERVWAGTAAGRGRGSAADRGHEQPVGGTLDGGPLKTQ